MRAFYNLYRRYRKTCGRIDSITLATRAWFWGF